MKSVVEDIKKGSFRPVYLFYGEEAYLKQQYKNKLKNAVLPDGDTINLSVYTGKGIDVKEMIAQAETMPFFAEHRLLLIEDSGFFKNANQQLADYIPSIPDGTILLFVESEVDKRGRLYKAVSKKGSVVEFMAQNEQTLTRWILGILKGENKKITTGAMNLFLEKTGTDMERIRQELEKLTAQIKQDERQKRKYELSLMQAQINPHFFYNVLDLIYISCYQKQEKQAATVTRYLADYYRCVLSNGKELIPIREEFRMLQNYLLIQRYRYATILDFQIEAEPEAENYIIPKMTLQPLVENSLYHGIKEKTSPGIIKILSRVRTDHITLCVCDNGVGMEQAKLRRYLNSPEAEDHFGLKSVYNRLFLYYNNKCKFRIFSQKDTGTAVVICIPKNWEEL